MKFPGKLEEGRRRRIKIPWDFYAHPPRRRRQVRGSAMWKRIEKCFQPA